MFNRLTLVRYLIPLLAVGAFVFGARHATAADSDGRLVAASTTRKVSVASAAKRAAPKPAAKPVAVSAPAPLPVTDAAPAVRQAISEDVAWGQVNAENVNIRTAPNTRSSIVVTVRGGEYVKTRAIQGGWYEIQWPQSAPVWVGKEFVQVSADSTERSGTISSPTARVFSAGTPQSTLVAKLDKGASVAIVGEEGNWYKIKAPEAATAYIFSRYVIAGVEAPSAAQIKPVAIASAVAPAPAAKVAAKAEPAAAPKPTAEESAAVKATLSATIEDTRRQLQDADLGQAEGARLAAEAVKKEAEEQARRETETQRVAELEAAETKKKLEAEEVARHETEARKKAEIEEQTRRAAEARRMEAIETARLATEEKKRAEVEEAARRETEVKQAAELQAAQTRKKLEAEEQNRLETEARKKAEAEEQARREAETRRLEHIETARVAAEAKKKADAEEQSRLDMELKKKAAAEEQAARETALIRKKAEESKRLQAETEAKAQKKSETAKPAAKIEAAPLEPDNRGGLFLDPSTVAPAPAAPAKVVPVEEPQSFSPLPSPSRSTPVLEKAEQPASIAYKPLNIRASDAPVTPSADEASETMPIPPLPDASKRVRSKFVMPSREPARVVNRAEIVDLGSGNEIEEPAALPTTPLLKPAQPTIEIPQDGLPAPTSAAPASIRLKPHAQTRVGSSNTSGPVITVEGSIERAALSPVEGADYALVRDGRTLHYLTARGGVDLEKFVGRRITVTGQTLQGTSTEEPVLEISSVNARE